MVLLPVKYECAEGFPINIFSDDHEGFPVGVGQLKGALSYLQIPSFYIGGLRRSSYLLSTSVLRASPSTSSAMITRGFLWVLASSRGL